MFKNFLHNFAQKVRAFAEWTESHKTLVAVIVTTLFVGIHIPIALNHEPWYDEIVPWELSKEITVENYYEVNHAEPHPPLWQIILAVFSQNDASVQVLSFISLALVAAAVFLLWRFSPFRLGTKLILTLSVVFFYFNPIVARDYALIPLAIMLVAIGFENRTKHPLRYGLALAFLFQTHFIMWGIAGLLVLEFIESCLKKPAKSAGRQPEARLGKRIMKVIIALVPILIAMAVCVPTIINCMNTHAIITKADNENNTPLDFFSNFNTAAFGIEFAIFEITAICILIYLLARHTKWFFIALVTICYMFLTFAFVYSGYTRFTQKASTFLMVYMLIFWFITVEERSHQQSKEKFSVVVCKLLKKLEIVRVLQHYANKGLTVTKTIGSEAAIVFCLPFLCSIPYTIHMAQMDMEGNYDPSKYIASIINEMPDNSVFIVNDDANQMFFTAAMPFLEGNRKFYDALTDEYRTQLVYDQNFYNLVTDGASDEKMLEVFSTLSKEFDHVYFFTNNPTCASAVPDHVDLLDNPDDYKSFVFDDYLTEYSPSFRLYTIK